MDGVDLRAYLLALTPKGEKSFRGHVGTYTLPEVCAVPSWSPCLFRDEGAVSGDLRVCLGPP